MPTHYRGSTQETTALDAYIKLMRAAESVTARLEPLMRAADLTVGQFGALEALLHLGPLCQRDLGRKLLRSGGNTTVVVGNLARRGLVRRTRRPDDRRFITVTLTDKGRRLIGGMFPRHAQHVVREMRALSLADQAELGRLCRRLGLADAGSVAKRRPAMAPQPTRFGSLQHYEKGGVEVIKDDPRNYVFSNVFEVASKARPYEKVAVGKNIEYVIEAIRAEGTSGWRVAAPGRVRPRDGRRGRGAAGQARRSVAGAAGQPGLDSAGRRPQPARRWAACGPGAVT